MFKKDQRSPSQGLHMIGNTSERQLSLEGFILSFGGKLNPENRWVKLSARIPWDELAKDYHTKLAADRGRPAKNARMVIGAVIIKHRLTLSDEETVMQIQENPYLQYFIGLSRYQEEPAFAPSLFVEIRRRMGDEVFTAFEKAILAEIERSRKKREPAEKDQEPPSHHGKLVVDATVAEQAVRYPTDLGLLKESREITEELIDELVLKNGGKKPRTYRQQARKRYLNLAKNKKPAKRLLRQGIRQQLQYLRRNLAHIDGLLDAFEEFPLSARKQRQYWVIQQVYNQQLAMYQSKSCRCDDRIVSIHQPHVRPIVRGKAQGKTEFGGKITVSLVDGVAMVDHLGWDAFNEGQDLQEQVENYRSRYGCFPEVVLADGIYGSRDNREYLRDKGIRFGGEPLGRPKKQTELNAEQLKLAKRQCKQDAVQRIPIEGKFGQGKNGYRLNYVRARTPATSESWIRAIFLVMNLLVLIRSWCVLRLKTMKSVVSRFFAEQIMGMLHRLEHMVRAMAYPTQLEMIFRGNSIYG